MTTPKPDPLIPLTLHLTTLELTAASRATVVITSPGDTRETNAAERAHRKLRDAAHHHRNGKPQATP